MSAGQSGRQLLLVVGVGRSGTSLMAGMLGQMGFQLPQPEVKANATNPRGFGEPRWVVDFHHKLMRRRRVTVNDSRPSAWERTYDAGTRAPVRDELREWLRDELGHGADVVVKDPRTVWFLPLWTEVAAELGAGTATITMLRHPAEVIASAKKSYGDWQSDASRASAWINVILETERVTRDGTRAFVGYETLLADWPGEMRRVGALIGSQPLAGATPERFPGADAFVDPTLHRNRVGWDAHDVPARVREIADDVWELLLRLAADGGDTPAVRASLDSARERYLAMHAEAEAIVQSAIVAAKRREGADGPAPAPAAAPLKVRIARRIPRRHRRRLRGLATTLRAKIAR
ncbi:MAG: sulfotransferase [Solirubrobacteraceae bacterium]